MLDDLDEADQRAAIRAMHDRIRMVCETRPLIPPDPPKKEGLLKRIYNWLTRRNNVK